MPRKLEDAVAVITGASSGIGRATATMLAERGTRVVLAARDELSLAEVGALCEAAGAEALIVPTDVSDADAVDALGARAVERFGRVDVWINNAGVIAYGHFEDIPLEVYRHVIETNFFGQVNGARAALRCFRAQDAGVLINMASVWARVSSPYVSAYVASKFAIRAFSACLRQELADAPDIHVVTILPQSVDTPIYAHAANYTGRAVKPVPPVRRAEDIAQRIVWCAEDPRREVTDRRAGRLLELFHGVAPKTWARDSRRR